MERLVDQNVYWIGTIARVAKQKRDCSCRSSRACEMGEVLAVHHRIAAMAPERLLEMIERVRWEVRLVHALLAQDVQDAQDAQVAPLEHLALLLMELVLSSRSCHVRCDRWLDQSAELCQEMVLWMSLETGTYSGLLVCCCHREVLGGGLREFLALG